MFAFRHFRPAAFGQGNMNTVPTLRQLWLRLRRSLSVVTSRVPESRKLQERGYVPLFRPLVLSQRVLVEVRARLPLLFRGEFETGIYPDEMHWREGISKDDAPREVGVYNWSMRSQVTVGTNQPFGLGWKLFRNNGQLSWTFQSIHLTPIPRQKSSRGGSTTPPLITGHSSPWPISDDSEHSCGPHKNQVLIVSPPQQFFF